MEVIEFVGDTNRIRKVKAGYGINYLIAKKKAIFSTTLERKKLLEDEKKSKRREKKREEVAHKIKRQMAKMVVVIPINAGKEGHIFGTLSPLQIVEAIAKHKITLKVNQILAYDPIKKIGEYVIDIQLHANVIAELNIKLEKKG